MGVGDLIEHGHKAGCRSGLNGVVQIEGGQWLTLQRYALMDCTRGKQTRNRVRRRNRHAFHSFERYSKLGFHPLCHNRPANGSARITQSSAGGMQAVKPKAALGRLGIWARGGEVASQIFP